MTDYPPPPEPDIVLPFTTALEAMALLNFASDVIEAHVPNMGRAVANLRRASEAVEHRVQEAAA